MLRSVASRSIFGALSFYSVSTRSFCDAPKNPLFVTDGLPRFAEIKPEHVVPAVEKHLLDMKNSFSEFELGLKEKKVSSYKDVVERLEILENPLSTSWGVVGHLMGVKNSDPLREAHEAMQPKVVEALQAIGQNQHLYEAYSDMKKTSSIWKSLDEAQHRIIDAAIHHMQLSGVSLPPEKREKFNQLQIEASKISTQFSNHVLDATKAFALTLTDPNDVEGLPASARSLAAQTAVQRGHSGATAESGPWVLTLDIPSYLPAMQHLKSSTLREKLYRASVSRASQYDQTVDANAAENPVANEGLIVRLLQIRSEMAGMLGYETYADLSLSSKMASSVEKVRELEYSLRRSAYKAAQQELAEVQEFARSQGFQGDLQLWDLPFWSERLREDLYEVEQEALRPYFALPQVLEGMFGLAQRIFGITIKEAPCGTSPTSSVQVWHPDVRFYHVHDSITGAWLASFYLDPYSRPAEKRGGAWMDVCINRSQALQQEQPVAYLVCNGSPPVDNQPSLMTFREVETLFHEFGHGLQHMLTKVPHGGAAGINNVEWDAVELPSQFMENFCYDEKTLYGFARHFETQEPLPRHLFQKIKASKNFQAGLFMLRQLYFGVLDLELHSSFNPFVPSKSPFDIQKEIAAQFTVLSPLTTDRFLCSFSHIFAGGYAAGYYSYMWAEVMSADAFEAFEEVWNHPHLTEAEKEVQIQALGRKFRDTVLSMGGGKSPAEVYRQFRGRDPSPIALLRQSGLYHPKE